MDDLLGVIRLGPEAVALPEDEHVQIALVDILEATLADRLAIGTIAVDR